jgi:methanogenic corrinoid protein MtbC1
MEALLAMDPGRARGLLCSEDGAALPLEEAEAIIVPALERIGLGWDSGELALSQVYMSGRQCEAIVAELQPARSGLEASGIKVAVAILEDYHSLGLRLVTSALRSGGVRLVEYGRMGVEELAAKASADGIDMLLVSVLMLRSALRVRALKDALDATGRRVTLIVGGAPFRLDKDLWKEVGADGTSDSAAGAVALVRRLSEEARA